MKREWRTDPDTEAALNWRVSKRYWFEERKVTEEEYEIIVRGCTASAAGFCESCMGKELCERQAKTIIKLNKVRNAHLYDCEYSLFCPATNRESCVGCKAHIFKKKPRRWRLWKCIQSKPTCLLARIEAREEIVRLERKGFKAKIHAPLPEHKTSGHTHVVVLCTLEEKCKLAGI